MTEPAIEVTDLSKHFRLYHERNTTLKTAVLRRRRARFEEFWALRDVSLEVPSGQTFGLIGHNGSGKSTLLKCMARILYPDEGTVRVRGKVSALLELGAGFHPELSGRENVYLNGSILGLSHRELERKFDEIVEFAGLERFIDTPVKNYSSGMYVRLGFSVAINVEPDVLLIDEVLAVGDEQFQRRCNEKLADLKAAGRTIVVVSHALGTMRTLCDQVAWLDHGRICEIGPAGTVVERYLDEVHEDREAPQTEGSRWGSGEARIERIELIDASGRPTQRLRMGEPAIVRLHYVAESVDRPSVGFIISTLDGIELAAPNTRDAEAGLTRLDGKGVIDFHISAVPLMPATYDVSTAIFDDTGLHPYDVHRLALRFDVDPARPRQASEGKVALPGEWRIDADGDDA